MPDTRLLASLFQEGAWWSWQTAIEKQFAEAHFLETTRYFWSLRTGKRVVQWCVVACCCWIYACHRILMSSLVC